MNKKATSTQTETLARLVLSVDAMAKAKGLNKPHHIDTLVGKAVRAMADGAAPIVALEVARIAAAEMAARNTTISMVDQLIDMVTRADAPLAKIQAI